MRSRFEVFRSLRNQWTSFSVRTPRNGKWRPQCEELEDRVLLSPGDLDPSFDGDGRVLTNFSSNDSRGDAAYSLRIQQDGKIVAAGIGYSYYSDGGAGDIVLLRYNTDGTLDSSFDQDGIVSTGFFPSGFARPAVVIQSDGKIIVGGSTWPFPSTRDFALARYNPDGGLDATFGSNGQVITNFGDSEGIAALAVQSDGRIVAAGRSGVGGIFGALRVLARYNTDGSLDQSFDGDGKVTTDFGPEVTATAYGIAIQQDGKIITAGAATPPGLETQTIGLARYNSNGSLDTTFGPAGSGMVTTGPEGFGIAEGIALQSDGKSVVVGEAGAFGIPYKVAVVRYNADGSLDGSFGTDGMATGGSGSGHSIVIQPDGKIVVAGAGSEAPDFVDSFLITRFNSVGTVDTGFGSNGQVLTTFPPGGGGEANAVALQSDGNIVAAGFSYQGFFGGTDFALARYEGGPVQSVLCPPISGTAVDFDGVDDYVQVDTPANMPSSSITVEAWVKLDSYHRWASVVDRVGGSLLDAFSLGLDNQDGKRLMFQWNNSSNGNTWPNKVVGNSVLPLGQFVHVAVSSNGSTATFYINGETDGTAPVGALGTTGPVVIGANFPGGDEFFDGVIDDVRIWNTARTQSDIQGKMNSTLSGNESGLVAYWRFDEASGITASDQTANNNDGVLGAGTASRQPQWVSVIGSTYWVTTTNDSGPGTLVQAIDDANANPGCDRISFNIPGLSPHTIQIRSVLLPFVTDPVIIDATTQPGFAGTPVIELDGGSVGDVCLVISAGNSVVRGLVINRFIGAGIVLVGKAGNVIEGNYIGTDVSGANPLGNIGYGLYVVASSDNTIGGSTAASRNVISGNAWDGVLIGGAGSTGNTVTGNYVGINASGTAAMGNGMNGVMVADGAANNVVGGTTAGTANVIAFNGFDGVYVESGTGNGILSNSIYGNGGLGIDLGNDGVTLNDTGDSDTGANSLQNFPVLTTVDVVSGSVTIVGTLNSTANTQFRLEFFADSARNPSLYGEGQWFLGATSKTTSASGVTNFAATFTLPALNATYFMATATSPTSDTSEFSLAQQDNVAPARPVINAITTDTGISSSDGITSDQTLIFSGTAEPGALVTLTRVGIGTIGSTTANTSGAWSFDYRGTTIPAGDYSFTATATDAAGNASPASLTFSVRVDRTAPTADIVDVTPDPRTTYAGTVTINFDEPVSGVDITDFSLTRDGSVVSLSGLGVTQVTSSEYSIDLSSVTSTTGAYIFKLTASGSEITDTAGIALTADASDSFVVQPSGPQCTGVDGFGYQACTYSFESLNLVPGGAGVVTLLDGVDDGSASISFGSNTFNFYGVTFTGSNQLFVSTNGLIAFGTANTDFDNADLTSSPAERSIAPLWDDWRTDVGTGSAVLYKFEDSNGNGVPERLIIEWNNVPPFGFADPVTFQAILQLNTGANASNITFNYPDLNANETTVDNGASATVGIKDINAQGANRLLVSFDGSPTGWLGSNRAIQLFLTDIAAPSANIVDVTPDPRNTNAGTVTINFNEPITGADIGDFSLTRNGSAVSMAGLSVTPVTATQYTVDLAGVTAAEGVYVLTLTAAGSGIQDLAGNALASNATDSWTMDTALPIIDNFDLDSSSDNNPATTLDDPFSSDNRTFDSTPNFTVAVTDVSPGVINGVTAVIDVVGVGTTNDGSCTFGGFAANATSGTCVFASNVVIPQSLGRQINLTVTDTAGNTRMQSILIDVDTSPINTVASTFGLDASSDNGPAGSVASDSKTNDTTPSFSGRIRDSFPFTTAADAAGLTVQLDSDNDGQFDDGTAVTDSNGDYVVTSTTTLSSGTNRIARLQVFDAAGNSLSTSPTNQTLLTTFTVDTVSPRVTSFSPFPGMTTAPAQLAVTFDNTDVDGTKIVPANFSLTNMAAPATTVDISGTMLISPANLVNNGNGTSTLTVPLTTPPASGVLTFTIRATAATGIADVTGNGLDGEFTDKNLNGILELADLPSGNGVAGGNFVAQFTFDNTAPTITMFRLADVSDIQTQPGNTGSNVDDDRTDDTTPVFTGTLSDTFPGSQALQNIKIEIDVDGDGFDDGSAFADAAGNFTVTSITAITPDTTARTILARATDNSGFGNVSVTAQAIIGVDTLPPDSTIELRTDAGAILPYNRTNDSTSVFGGVLTDQGPFTAAVAGNVGSLLIELDVDGNGFNDGSATTNGTGAWQIQSSTTLAAGSYPNVRIQFSDKAGHQVIKSLAGGFVIDPTPPRVTAIAPIGVQGTRPTSIVVTFDESMFDVSAGSLFANSVLNPANFSLVRSNGDGVFGDANNVSITPTNFAYSEVGGNRLTITLPAGLPDDTYRLTLEMVTDRALNQLDGEFNDRNTNGTFELFDLPSGNGVAGGAFVSTYSVDTAIPTINVALNLPQFSGGFGCPEFFPAFGDNSTTPGVEFAGDTGTPCDARTNLTRPFLSGRVTDLFPGSAAGLPIALDANNDTLFNEGTTTTLADGTYAIQPIFDLPEGTRTMNVRVTDRAGNAAIVTTTIVVDRMPPGPPSTPNLDDGSDTFGVGTTGTNTDNITNDDTPTFNGTAEPNGTVTLFANVPVLNTLVGSAPADQDGNWSITLAPNVAGLVAVGQSSPISFTARATDPAGNTNTIAGGTLSVMFDRQAPTPISTPNLDATSDSGNPTDDITNDNTPLFRGTTGVPDTNVVTLLNGSCTPPPGTGSSIGTTTLLTGGNWNINSLTTLADGQYNILAAATDKAGNTSASGCLLLTVDTVTPAPQGLALAAGSDSGISASDNITRGISSSVPPFNGTVTITGTAELQSTVTLSNAAGVLGQAIMGDDASNGILNDRLGRWTFTSTLPEGLNNVAATAVDVAANTSNVSQTLMVTIDTRISKPVITGISPDNGPSSTDRKTNNARITFTGTADPGDMVTLNEGGTALGSPVIANSSGVWTFDNTANLLSDGIHTFTATSSDLAGNGGNSAAMSNPVSVEIDTVAPPAPNPPTLFAADDHGVQGDDRTNLKRPRLTGTTEAGAFVEILSTFNAVLGTARADGSGIYVVQVGVDLADDIQSLRIRASDQFGNGVPNNVSSEYPLTMDTTRPEVRIVTPMGTLTANTPQIVVTFNNDDLNNTTAGNPAFAGSAQNPTNYSLVGDGNDNIFGTADDRVIDLSASTYVYDMAADQLIITLLNAGGSPIQLPNDNYRFTINGTTSVQDIAGNSILGGNFVQPFVVNVPPPRAIGVRTEGTRKVVQRVFVAFSVPMDRTAADADSNYELRDAGKDKRFGTRDDKFIVLSQAGCSANSADCSEVTLQATRGFSRKRAARLTIRDALSSAGGIGLDGDGDGQPGGDFVTVIGTNTAPRQSSQVAAQVVDRLLDTGASAGTLFVDPIARDMRRGKVALKVERGG